MRFCSCCRPFPEKSAGLSRRRLLAGTAGTAALIASEASGANPLTDLLGSLVSPEQERALGNRAFAELKRQVPVSRDQERQTRLERVGKEIVAASDAAISPDQWEFVVFADDQINAFALPGGKVGFFEGIFELMDNDAQLATVLAHEVAHVNARHHAERIGAETASNIGTSILGQALGLDPGSGLDRLLAGALGMGVQFGVLMPYSRGQELEADSLGLGYMAEAGYDPAQAIAFWQKMMRAGGAKPPVFLSTHPSDQARIDRIRTELPAAEAVFDQSR